jgi:methylated-DNA-protein-cysteine methyltransferase-like protein
MLDKSDFFENVYAVVKLIPSGRVTTYGAIACYLGSKQSSRMVGWAMNASHKINGIPAHRVVNRKGILTGKHHFDTSNRMQELLEEEGVKIDEDRIVNYNELFWDPMKELEIL